MSKTEELIIASLQVHDFDGPHLPALTTPALTDELPVVKGERVEELGAFGALTGELGTVLAADDSQAVVKWDDDGREILRQRYLQRLFFRPSNL